MTEVRPWAKGLVCVLVAFLAAAASTVSVNATGIVDSLTLQQPEIQRVWRVFDSKRNAFTVFLTWNDIADSCGTFIHQPDTSGWAAGTPSDQLAVPFSRGVYTGSIDRTIIFQTTGIGGGVVGQDEIVIRADIRREENFSRVLTIPPTYQPGEWIPVVFRDFNNQEELDLGLEISLGPGIVDNNGRFTVGCEDFEGFHIWRGVKDAATDMGEQGKALDACNLEIIGEVSKEEAFVGQGPGGDAVDSVYFEAVIPTLRQGMPFFFEEPFKCLGSRLDVPLSDDEYMWFDCNAFNGFTYFYAVTTFDRDYEVGASRQGLVKFDNCQPSEPHPTGGCQCKDVLFEQAIEVDSQSNLKLVYAVPNPYRDGPSRITRANYHNFPDDLVRFVNVPANCLIKIYTVAGDLVWEGEHTGASGNIEWDTRNSSGEKVASGVYIFKVEDSGGDEVYGRLVIIRGQG